MGCGNASNHDTVIYSVIGMENDGKGIKHRPGPFANNKAKSTVMFG